jgi:hypothetical protein
LKNGPVTSPRAINSSASRSLACVQKLTDGELAQPPFQIPLPEPLMSVSSHACMP